MIRSNKHTKTTNQLAEQIQKKQQSYKNEE